MAKRKTTTRRRRRYVSRTSRRTSSRVSGDKMIDDLKFAAAVGTGLILGKSVAGFVDQGTNTVSGMMGIDGTDLKQFIRPVVTAGIGLVTHQMVKHPLIKRVGLGIAAYGVVDGVQKITGQKMLAGPGLGDVPPSYQALPEYQIPVMGPDDDQEEIVEEVSTEIQGAGDIGDLSAVTGNEITAGLDGDGSISAIDEDDDLAITA
ncbi:hypothetical protein [Marinilabilia salmonicolor]|uniref:hypothetical protein n=1 Tax=Marinilabilia salmonicolor TaxID=989 RepID=UPI00029AACB7|nr:hypothetical protein [Marinilabilia salmonicolor]